MRLAHTSGIGEGTGAEDIAHRPVLLYIRRSGRKRADLPYVSWSMCRLLSTLHIYKIRVHVCDTKQSSRSAQLD